MQAWSVSGPRGGSVSAAWPAEGRVGVRGQRALGQAGCVAEEFEQVVGGGDQLPLVADGGEAAAGEAGDLAGVFGVCEDRFDEFGAAAVERAAGLGVKQGLDAVGFGALQTRASTLAMCGTSVGSTAASVGGLGDLAWCQSPPSASTQSIRPVPNCPELALARWSIGASWWLSFACAVTSAATMTRPSPTTAWAL